MVFCPSNCRSKVKAENVLAHFKKIHGVKPADLATTAGQVKGGKTTTSSGLKKFPLNLVADEAGEKVDFTTVQLLSVGDTLVFVTQRQFGALVHFWVYMTGPRASADKCKVKMSLSCGGRGPQGHHPRLDWHSKAFPLDDPMPIIMAHNECLVLGTLVAKRFQMVEVAIVMGHGRSSGQLSSMNIDVIKSP